MQDNEFYTLPQLAARLNRSVICVRTRMKSDGRIPWPRPFSARGPALQFPVGMIEEAIAANPDLVQKKKRARR